MLPLTAKFQSADQQPEYSLIIGIGPSKYSGTDPEHVWKNEYGSYVTLASSGDARICRFLPVKVDDLFNIMAAAKQSGDIADMTEERLKRDGIYNEYVPPAAPVPAVVQPKKSFWRLGG